MGTTFCAEQAPSSERRPAAFQTLYKAGHTVELAATVLGPSMPGIRAYHTSVVVDDKEYSFSFDGITIASGLLSHGGMPNGPPKVMYMGLTSITGKEMKDKLRAFFQRGTYDLLRKNCNSFSDCALFYLLDVRLDPTYRGLEKLGHNLDRNAKIIQRVSGGEYLPNGEADGFDVEDVVKDIDEAKQALGIR